MFGIADYGAFVVAIIVFLAIPGPGNLALLTATGKGGVRSGMAATLGVIVGDQVLLWLALAGLSAVLINYPGLYSSVKWAGAAYLIGLGYSLFNVKPGEAPVLDMKPGHYFRQALFITVLNPKIETLDIEVEIRKDQLVLDELPDEACHFVAIEFDDRVCDLDLCHWACAMKCEKLKSDASYGNSEQNVRRLQQGLAMIMPT
jgi:hypothetical protein